MNEKNMMKSMLIPFFFIIIMFMYGYFCLTNVLLHNGAFTSPFAYYNYLIDAFFQGRLHITPEFIHHDLLFFHEKWYMHWGIGPVVFILPFYMIWGVYVSDVAYTLCSGILNVWLFFLVLRAFARHIGHSLTTFEQVFFLLNFAFITPNFLLSARGEIWSTYQLISITYLLSFLLFFLKFLNTHHNKTFFLILSLGFFTLAWLSRSTLIFHGLLYLYPLSILIKQKMIDKKKSILSYLLYIALFLCIGVAVYCTYNYLRFGNYFEAGYRFQSTHPRYGEIMTKGPLLSFEYFSHNAYYYFINLPYSFKAPFFTIDPEGNSIFAVYPFLLLYIFLRKKHLVSYSHFFFISGLVISINILFLLLLPFTGWVQFGSRYIFDVLPLTLLILVGFLRAIPRPILLTELLYGISINFLGVGLFMILNG